MAGRIARLPRRRRGLLLSARAGARDGRAHRGRRGLPVTAEPGLLECDYGEWTGLALKDLRRRPEWKVDPALPERIPLSRAASRSPRCRRGSPARSRDWSPPIPGHTVVAVSHADPIKTAVAHALGTHLDLFQRIAVFTASVTAIAYGPDGPDRPGRQRHAGRPRAPRRPMNALPCDSSAWRPPAPLPRSRGRATGRERRGVAGRADERLVRLLEPRSLHRGHDRPAGPAGLLPPGPRGRHAGDAQVREGAGPRARRVPRPPPRAAGGAGRAPRLGTSRWSSRHAGLDRGLDRRRLRRGDRPRGAGDRGGPRAGGRAERPRKPSRRKRPEDAEAEARGRARARRTRRTRRPRATGRRDASASRGSRWRRSWSGRAASSRPGGPTCRLCGRPMNPGGHRCARTNGHGAD